MSRMDRDIIIVPVLIVEDCEATARKLAKIVGDAPGLTVSDCVHDVASALRALTHLKPRVVLVDLGLPDGSGLDIINACAHADWDCEAVVLSIFGDEERVIEAIRHGATGYLQKGARAEEIVRGIKTVLSGGAPISPQIARHLLLELTRRPSEPSRGASDLLTQRELEILNAIAEGYKRQEVAERLNISVGTVGNHINRIFKKLGVNSNLSAVAKAGRMGLL